MNSKNRGEAPNPIYNFVVISILLLVIGFFLLKLHQDKLNDRHKITELEEDKYDIELKLQESYEQRDSLYRITDSLSHISEINTALIKQKDRELKSIKGRFDKFTNRELEQKMTEEWQKSVK